VTAIVDTNILVYLFDRGVPLKREQARELIGQGIAAQSIVLPYQALIEFVSVTTRARRGRPALLTTEEAHREVEQMMTELPVVYPTKETLKTALNGAALYQMSWFDALIWAYAEENGFDPLWSEDFQDGRIYGSVMIENPFSGDGSRTATDHQ